MNDRPYDTAFYREMKSKLKLSMFITMGVIVLFLLLCYALGS